MHIWIFELLELTAYNLELVTASYDHPTNMRIFLSALGYSLRPLIPYILIKLINRVEDKKIYEVLLILPWVLAVILSFSAFFTDIAYSYDAQNVFHRGPLGYFCQVITVLYMFILMIRAIRSHILKKDRIKGNAAGDGIYHCCHGAGSSFRHKEHRQDFHGV